MLIFFLIGIVQSLEFPLLNLDNIYYSLEISVQDHKFNMILDTGSSTTWIMSENCLSCKASGHFNLLEDSSSKQASQRISISYGIGQVGGPKIQKEISLLKENQFNMTILAVDKFQDLNDYMGDGLIGLAKRDSSDFTFIEAMYASGLIKAPIFALQLNSLSCSKQSKLVIGEVETIENSAIKYVKSNAKEAWDIEFKQARLGKNVLLLKSKILMIDSGTTKITLPQESMSPLIKQFNNKHKLGCTLEQGILLEMVCESTNLEDYPDLVFEVEDIERNKFELILSGQDYIDRCYYSWISLKCKLKFEQLEGEEIVLGVVFLHKYFSIFNLQDQTIGISKSSYYDNDKKTINDFYLISYGEYLIVLKIFGLIGLMLVVIYLIGKWQINNNMSLYASVLEKSSARSDQEMTNLKTKSLSQISLPSSPGNNKE